VAPDAEERCPRCGSPVERMQEYCLECGLRLHTPGLVPALAQGWRRRLRWYPGDWIWPSLLALLVAALAAAGAILWTRDAQSAPSETLVGDTSPLPTTVVTTAPTTAAGPTVPTVTTKTTSTGKARPGPRKLIEWPRNRSAWTLVLASLPTSSGRKAAMAKARQALDADLGQVGVLDSARYSSLHPGYYVVFSGIYDSLGDAQDAVSEAADAGYENAYARRITPAR
jgi:hypothetical protein